VIPEGSASNDPRIELAFNLIQKLALGDFSARVTPSDRKDVLDAIIAGLNMLGEELAEQKHAFAATIKKLSDSRSATIHMLKDIEKSNNELTVSYGKLEEKEKQLERFNNITVGRELEMIKLKAEVNELLEKLGQPPKYERPKK